MVERRIRYSVDELRMDWGREVVLRPLLEKRSNEMCFERGTRCADWLASSSPSRAAFQSKLILTIPVAFFDLRQWSVVGRCMRSAVATKK